ncbi:MAG: peptidylprolyl isomerase [Burkholderia sp.]|nr:peptidylprolyl isomerase [Burkholderia sp.]
MRINKILLLQPIVVNLVLSLLLLVQTQVVARVIKPYNVQVADKIVAVINDDVVTNRELDQWIKIVLSRLKQNGITPVTHIDELRRQVLNEIIIKYIQLKKAKENNIYISDELDQALQYLAQESGISLNKYRSRIEAHGISWHMFLKNICTELMISKLRKLTFENKINVSDEEAAIYMAKQKTMFDSMKIVQTQVRHILLSIGKDKSESKVRKQLLNIRKQIKDGVDFSMLARRYSQDSSALDGGYLGWIQSGEMTPELDNAINALKEGEISKPVRTKYGYHLIQVLGRRNIQNSIQEKTEIAHRLIGQLKENKAYLDWLHKLRNSSYVQYKLSEIE